ncbi:MAG: GPW/gp25 family protein [Pseudoalteromonas sp.]|uniref:GPW/gp25 family protein n=1 Tax=Pseudoalteromonas sp. TaxID=53249 RepID=UPI001D536C3A|nr:GPW/gp25 family protein [Pseudoalteromonas sp.]NRA76883.1 GPW/gp25 family protein [Pseudoalteromonas sp.]
MYKDVSVYSPTTKPEVVDIVSVQQSLINLILTRPGERPFNPQYGLNTEAMLFDLADDTTALALYNELVQKVKVFEPRVKLNTSETDVSADLDNNRINITLVFEILGFEGKQYEIQQPVG